MSRFGLLVRRCKRQDLRTLNLLGSATIDEHSFTLYKDKLDAVYLKCLNNGKWYKLKYKPFDY